MRIVCLGAGFGGLELATVLSHAFGDELDLTLIDKGAAFCFGFSKLDLIYGRTTPDAIRLPYIKLEKPGVRFVQETITAIDPENRRVTTDQGEYEADVLVIALGADYDFDATPGLRDSTEFYSLAGAERLAEILPSFTHGRALIGVCGAPFKCPPAPSEAALLLHDYLTERGARTACEIMLVMPFGIPIPPSPDTSQALLEAFAERNITFVPNHKVARVERNAAILDDDTELVFDLFLGVPKHRAPDVVQATGMTVDGYIPVDSRTLTTRYPGVYALGDCATVGVPKAGFFSERQARALAKAIIEGEGLYDGLGQCLIEFGGGRVGRVDVDFLSGPKPIGVFQPPSPALVAEKKEFGASRRARWFGAVDE